MRDPAQSTRFELLDCIGRGGLAEVYRANQHGLRGFVRRVAIKRLRRELAFDDRHRERLIHEAKLGATLDHPNLVQTLDLVFLDGEPVIVLELIDGPDLLGILTHLTQHRGELPLELGVHIAIEVLTGLAYAIDTYGPTLVHGDVTPGNIMLSRHGDVRLVDFGVASVKLDRALRGKPAYLSPELVRGEVPDHRSDLFALATTLWESLTLKRLFASDDPDKTRDNVMNVRITRRFARPGRVPPELGVILRKALAKDPDERFQTAHEMAQALRGFLDARGARVSRATLAEFLITTGPVKSPQSVMEPPPLPTVEGPRLGPPTLERPHVSSFAMLARGELDDRLARLSEDTPALDGRRPPRSLGPLDPSILPGLFSAIANHELTGAVELTQGPRKKVLYFLEGGLTHVSSNVESERLGQRLADAGLIPEKLPDVAARYARAHKIRLGEALIELQVTTPERLSRALDAQLSDGFVDVLSWERGELTFDPDGHFDSGPGKKQTRLDVLTLVLRGLRENWSEARVASLLTTIASALLYWTAAKSDVSRVLFLSASDDERLMSLEDGQLIGDRAREGHPMRFLLVALIALGFVRVRGGLSSASSAPATS